jgi:hypothetical protein
VHGIKRRAIVHHHNNGRDLMGVQVKETEEAIIRASIMTAMMGDSNSKLRSVVDSTMQEDSTTGSSKGQTPFGRSSSRHSRPHRRQ